MSRGQFRETTPRTDTESNESEKRESTTPTYDRSVTSPTTCTNSERYYRCINCGDEFEQFQLECPVCGQREFQTGRVGDEPAVTADENEKQRRIDDVIARLNPYVPRY